jgi:benzoate-CoA ligase family protein
MTSAPTFPEHFNLADYFLFDRLREGLGGRTCIVYGARSYSYELVALRARAFAGALARSDVRRGERVLLALPDVPAFAWAFFGALARGCVVAMANPDAPAEALHRLLEYTGATALVTTPRVWRELRSRAERASPASGGTLRRVWGVLEATALDEHAGGVDPDGDCEDLGAQFRSLPSELRQFDPGPAPPITHRDEPAVWLFTSGSSGEPRANIHTHRDFAYSTEVYAKRTIGFAPGDITLSVPRLFFGYATGTNLMFPLAVGACAALYGERPTAAVVARAIERYRPTVLTNVPTMIRRLLELDEERRGAGQPGLDLSSVRFSLSAGEALPEPLLRRWLDRFGGDVYDGIGSAEMFHIYATNRPGDVRPGSLGKAVEGYELRLLPQHAEGPGAVPVALGEVGVLWVKGDSVSQGYWLDRDKSWRTFFGHWCRTGDLFRMDQDGYLYFVGRADDLLKVSGLWVAPIEVEECLARHVAVRQAAVVGVSGPGDLAKTKAFVVLATGHAPSRELARELQAFVKERLAKHKYPRVIEFVAELPRNDRGKIDRRRLRVGEADEDVRP